MESEDKKPIFTKRFILTALAIILIILIILLLLRRCGNGNGGNHNVTGVTISPLYMTLAPGESQLLQTYVEPSDATNTRVTCSSSNPEVASVDPDTCLVHGIAEGTAEITATSDDGGKTATCTVVVTKSPSKLTGIELSSGTYTVKVGKSKLVSVKAVPSDAQLPELYYSITDESIATVNQNGVIKGVSVGTTTLVVRSVDGEHSAMATVKVIKNTTTPDCPEGQVNKNGDCVDEVVVVPKPTKISISGGNSVTLAVGDQYIIPFRIQPDDAAQEAVCTVENSTILSEKNCTITALAKGSTTVKVCAKADPNICDTLKVTVSNSNNGGSSPRTSSDPCTGSNCSGTTVKDKNAIIEVTASPKGSGWHKNGTCTFKVAGDITSISKITYSITDSSGVNGSQSGLLTSGVKTVNLPDTTGTITCSVTYTTVEGKSQTVKASVSKIDSTKPVCETFRYDADSKKIVVSASDKTSGIKSAAISGKSVNFNGSGIAQYSVSNTGTYSVVVYDVAGNLTSCGSIKISDLKKSADGKEGIIPVKVEVSPSKLTIHENEKAFVKAWVLMSDGSHRSVYGCTSSTLECHIGTNGGSETSLVISRSEAGKGLTATVEAPPAYDIPGATIKVDVIDKTLPTVTLKRSGNAVDGYSFKVEGKANNDGEIITKIEFGSSTDGKACKTGQSSRHSTETASATFSANLGDNYVGKFTACAKVTTSNKLTNTASYTYDVDGAAPSCIVQTYGDKYQVTASDKGTGVRNIKVNGTIKASASARGTNSLSATVSTTKNVTAVDWAGNETKCKNKSGTDKATKITVSCNPTTLQVKGAKSYCTAKVEPDTADQKVTWSESNEYISVNSSGVVTMSKTVPDGEKNVKAKVKATTSNNLSNTATLTLSPTNLMDQSSRPTCTVTAGKLRKTDDESNEIVVGDRGYVSVYCTSNKAKKMMRATDKSFSISDGYDSVITLSGNQCAGGYCSSSTYFSATYSFTAIAPGTVTFSVPAGLYYTDAGQKSNSSKATITVVDAGSKEGATYECIEPDNTTWAKEANFVVTISDNKPRMTYNAAIAGKSLKGSATSESVSLSAPISKNGTYKATGTIKDSDGNETKILCEREFTHIDKEKPKCSMTAEQEKTTKKYILTVTADDTGGSELQTSKVAGWTETGSGNHKVYGKVVADVGDYSFTIEDGAGNPATCGVSAKDFKILENKAPTIKITDVYINEKDRPSDPPFVGVIVDDDKSDFIVTVSGCGINEGAKSTDIAWAKSYHFDKNMTCTLKVKVKDSDGVEVEKSKDIKVDYPFEAPNCEGSASKSTIKVGEKVKVTFTCTIPSGISNEKAASDFKVIGSIQKAGDELSWSNGQTHTTRSGHTATLWAEFVGQKGGITTVSINKGAATYASQKSNGASVSITVKSAPTVVFRALKCNGYTCVGQADISGIPDGGSYAVSGDNCLKKDTYAYCTFDTNGKYTMTIKIYDKNKQLVGNPHTKTYTVDAIKENKPTLSISGGGKQLDSGNKTATLTATVKNPPASGVDHYSWKSSDKTCVTTGGSTTSKETVTWANPAKDCIATITVTAHAKNGTAIASKTTTISALNAKRPSLTLTPGSNSIAAAGSTSITVKANNTTTTIVNYTWSSTNTSCATVSSGKVTGVNTSTSSCKATIKAVGKDYGNYTVASGETTITVQGKTTEDFSCDTSTFATTNKTGGWTNEPVTIQIRCKGKDCATQTYIDGVNRKNITGNVEVPSQTLSVQSKTGAKKSCGSFSVKYDHIPPKCTYTDKGNTKWTKSYTVSVKCTDNGSGCKQGLGTRSKEINTTSLKTVNFLVTDNAGNSNKCGDHNVYVDITNPSLTCTVTANGSQSGVTVVKKFSDKHSGFNGYAAGQEHKTYAYYVKSGTHSYSVEDIAGNKASCTVKVIAKAECGSNEKVIPGNTTYCMKTSESGTVPNSCSLSGYTYNSSSKKCEKVTDTQSKSGSNSAYTCPSGYSVKNAKNVAPGVYTWDCVKISTMNPICPSGKTKNSDDGKCYTKYSKTTKYYEG